MRDEGRGIATRIIPLFALNMQYRGMEIHLCAENMRTIDSLYWNS